MRRYEALAAGAEVVESQLKEVLPELLNAEVTLRTISDVAQARGRRGGAWRQRARGGSALLAAVPGSTSGGRLPW